MKKLFFIPLIFFLVVYSYGQEKSICGEVHYVQTKNLDLKLIEFYSLKFNRGYSLYEEKNIVSSNDSIIEIDDENGTTQSNIIGRKNLNPNFYFNSPNAFYFREIFFDEGLLVKEEVNMWHWKLSNETKKIGNFLCQKAVSNFRGRDYVAWFAKDIPVHAGPWKFYGLPGLILEVYDENGKFHIQAQEIIIDFEKESCFIQPDVKDFSKSLSISEYLKKRKSLINDFFAELSSKLPKGTKPIELDENCKDCSQGLEIFNE